VSELRRDQRDADVAAAEAEAMSGRFVLFVDSAGQWRWRLVAANGEPIAQSEGYSSKQAAQNGIASVKQNAGGADVQVDYGEVPDASEGRGAQSDAGDAQDVRQGEGDAGLLREGEQVGGEGEVDARQDAGLLQEGR
jgi:uncharacterized protein YegP (UPF0339 family)